MAAVARTLVLASVLAASGGRVLAQDAPARRGFWLGLGFGVGSLARTCDVCDNMPGVSGPTAFVKLGATPDEQMQVGVEADWWRNTVDGSTITSGSALVVVQLYPWRARPLFLKGGIGGSLYREEAPVKPASDTAQTTGFGLTAGVGYDVTIGAHLYATPVINFVFGSLGNVRPGGVFMPGVQQTLLQFALGLTLH